ncbi:hypothetical protein B0H16DRAFT_1603555 [Mycena metata]|uniref:SHSP domain-containing protein n=1 Tax=Mycena metata TaxID=1033252 RepID=A0AAD7HHR0_9AGAR|nr:hypothetical protein B0H16DRAFT_1603555 [Mycena metata]
MTLNNALPGSCYQRNTSTNQDTIQRSQAVPVGPAKKAATFGVLSVCANRRVPSRVSRRVSGVHIGPSVGGVDRARNPWSFDPRRSSQARVDHISRSRVRSTRIPTLASVVPSNDSRTPSGLPNPHIPASVPHPLSSSFSASAQSPALRKPCPLPSVFTLARPPPTESRCLSLTARSRRVPTPSGYPPLQINSSAAKYTIDIALPTAIKPEMVTITTAKEEKLKIVADAWHLESNCHFEWEIVFPPQDVDIKSICAKFDAQGHLTVSAARCL